MNRKLKLNELNRPSVEEYKMAQKVPIIVVLDNIRSLSNVGSIFRTVDCFGLEAIYLCGITARPPHREITKTAIGATQSVDWNYFDNTIDAVDLLEKEGYIIASVEQAKKTIKLSEADQLPHKKLAVIFGNEVNGVAQEVVDRSDHCIEVEQFGTKHSLNVSVCVGIVINQLSTIYRQKAPNHSQPL